MSEPFLGQIQAFGFNFAPRGWSKCDGQLLPISQHQSLFSLLGTIYGGDGRSTFALPELRGRASLHEGNGPGLTPRTIGAKSGAERVTLTAQQIPQHTHHAKVNNAAGNSSDPTGRAPANTTALGVQIYNATVNQNGAVTDGGTGGGQGHENMQPYLVINWCIALQGLFPSRN